MVKIKRIFVFPAVFALMICILLQITNATAFAYYTDEGSMVKDSTGAYSVVVADYDNCLTSSEEQQLISQMKEAAKSLNFNIGIVIARDLEGHSDESYAKQFLYDQFGKNSNSIVLLLFNSYKKPEYSRYQDRIYTEGRADNRYQRYIDNMFDEIYNAMGDPIGDKYAYNESTKTYGGYNYFNACSVFVKAAKFYGASGVASLSKKIVNFVFKQTQVFFFFIVPTLIISITCVRMTIKKYKTKKPLSASNYIDRSKTRVTHQLDLFIREYTTHTTHSSGGHHHGGGHHGGGGGHHGGGGRHR